MSKLKYFLEFIENIESLKNHNKLFRILFINDKKFLRKEEKKKFYISSVYKYYKISRKLSLFILCFFFACILAYSISQIFFLMAKANELQISVYKSINSYFSYSFGFCFVLSFIAALIRCKFKKSIFLKYPKRFYYYLFFIIYISTLVTLLCFFIENVKIYENFFVSNNLITSNNSDIMVNLGKSRNLLQYSNHKPRSISEKDENYNYKSLDNFKFDYNRNLKFNNSIVRIKKFKTSKRFIITNSLYLDMLYKFLIKIKNEFSFEKDTYHCHKEHNKSKNSSINTSNQPVNKFDRFLLERPTLIPNCYMTCNLNSSSNFLGFNSTNVVFEFTVAENSILEYAHLLKVKNEIGIITFFISSYICYFLILLGEGRTIYIIIVLNYAIILLGSLFSYLNNLIFLSCITNSVIGFIVIIADNFFNYFCKYIIINFHIMKKNLDFVSENMKELGFNYIILNYSQSNNLNNETSTKEAEYGNWRNNKFIKYVNTSKNKILNNQKIKIDSIPQTNESITNKFITKNNSKNFGIADSNIINSEINLVFMQNEKDLNLRQILEKGLRNFNNKENKDQNIEKINQPRSLNDLQYHSSSDYLNINQGNIQYLDQNFDKNQHQQILHLQEKNFSLVYSNFNEINPDICDNKNIFNLEANAFLDYKNINNNDFDNLINNNHNVFTNQSINHLNGWENSNLCTTQNKFLYDNSTTSSNKEESNSNFNKKCCENKNYNIKIASKNLKDANNKHISNDQRLIIDKKLERFILIEGGFTDYIEQEISIWEDKITNDYKKMPEEKKLLRKIFDIDEEELIQFEKAQGQKNKNIQDEQKIEIDDINNPGNLKFLNDNNKIIKLNKLSKNASLNKALLQDKKPSYNQVEENRIRNYHIDQIKCFNSDSVIMKRNFIPELPIVIKETKTDFKKYNKNYQYYDNIIGNSYENNLFKSINNVKKNNFDGDLFFPNIFINNLNSNKNTENSNDSNIQNKGRELEKENIFKNNDVNQHNKNCKIDTLLSKENYLKHSSSIIHHTNSLSNQLAEKGSVNIQYIDNPYIGSNANLYIQLENLNVERLQNDNFDVTKYQNPNVNFIHNSTFGQSKNSSKLRNELTFKNLTSMNTNSEYQVTASNISKNDSRLVDLRNTGVFNNKYKFKNASLTDITISQHKNNLINLIRTENSNKNASFFTDNKENGCITRNPDIYNINNNNIECNTDEKRTIQLNSDFKLIAPPSIFLNLPSANSRLNDSRILINKDLSIDYNFKQSRISKSIDPSNVSLTDDIDARRSYLKKNLSYYMDHRNNIIHENEINKDFEKINNKIHISNNIFQNFSLESSKNNCLNYDTKKSIGFKNKKLTLSTGKFENFKETLIESERNFKNNILKMSQNIPNAIQKNSSNKESNNFYKLETSENRDKYIQNKIRPKDFKGLKTQNANNIESFKMKSYEKNQHNKISKKNTVSSYENKNNDGNFYNEARNLVNLNLRRYSADTRHNIESNHNIYNPYFNRVNKKIDHLSNFNNIEDTLNIRKGIDLNVEKYNKITLSKNKDKPKNEDLNKSYSNLYEILKKLLDEMNSHHNQHNLKDLNDKIISKNFL